MPTVLKPGPVSIRTVAARAGVSTATVSNVLNGKPNVSSQFAARVRAAVEELGYVADGYASRMRSGKQALAGVVVPDLANPMFAAFVSIIEAAARLDGFDLLVVSSANSPANEAARLNKIRSWRPAGVIVVPCDGALARRRPPAATWPIVVADRIPDDRCFDLIAVDNGPAASSVAAHLADQGFRDCLVVGSSLAITNVRERWKGVCAARGPMAVTILEVGLDRHVVAPLLRERLLEAPRPDAIFSLDHITAIEAYRVIGSLGLSIPEDIAFASFDESEWMHLVTPGVTAVRQPVEDMARSAWKQLMARMTGDGSPPLTSRLPCAIEFRGSTLRLPTVPESAAA